VPIPGTIDSEKFDNGGEGVEGGFDVGWIDEGEWLNYTVNVTAAGDYTVQLRVASIGGATFHVGFNGPSEGQWKTVSVAPTGGWQTWTAVNVPVTLGAGVQQMTLFFDTGGMNFRQATVGP
jgi:hypothetical protein